MDFIFECSTIMWLRTRVKIWPCLLIGGLPYSVLWLVSVNCQMCFYWLLDFVLLIDSYRSIIVNFTLHSPLSSLLSPLSLLSSRRKKTSLSLSLSLSPSPSPSLRGERKPRGPGDPLSWMTLIFWLNKTWQSFLKVLQVRFSEWRTWLHFTVFGERRRGTLMKRSYSCYALRPSKWNALFAPVLR